MGLLIIRINGLDRTIEDIWHVHEKIDYNRIPPREVVEIQADGHELDHIRRNILPDSTEIPRGRVVNFYGDQAKLIVGNLTNKPYEY